MGNHRPRMALIGNQSFLPGRPFKTRQVMSPAAFPGNVVDDEHPFDEHDPRYVPLGPCHGHGDTYIFSYDVGYDSITLDSLHAGTDTTSMLVSPYVLATYVNEVFSSIVDGDPLSYGSI